MRSQSAIESMWAEQGVDTSKHVSFFCGSGWRAAEETWDALAMGYDASMYNDGWQGWSNSGKAFIDKDGKLMKLVDNKLVSADEPVDTTIDFTSMDNTEWAKYGTETIADADYVVDVREAAAYDAGHIQGAVSAATTGSAIEAGSDAAKNLDKAFADAGDKRIVLICYGGMKYAKAAMTYLYAKDTSLTPDKVTYLIGGFNKWKTANPYCIGDMLVDPAAKTVEFKATVNSEYTTINEETGILPAISHFVLNKDTTDKSSPFVTSVKPLELHAALTALGALPWSDTARSFETGKTLNDVAGDNENFTHLDITVDGAPMASVLKYKKDGVEADAAGAIDMAFSGNKENQTAWNTGCVSCIFSCYAGIVSNAAVGIGTVDADHNYFYLDTDKLAGGQEVTLVYTLK
jgi:3-mercaptopyruvate sulfurtransferase SseA